MARRKVNVQVVPPDGDQVIVYNTPSVAEETAALYSVKQPQPQQKVSLAPGISFQEFEAVMLQLGFRKVEKPSPFLAYREGKSGAMVVLPQYQATDIVHSLHLNTFRKLVVEKGLARAAVAAGKHN